MMFRRRYEGYYYELIKYDLVEEVRDREYHNAIPFSYELDVRTIRKEDNNGVFKTNKQYILTTRDDLPFKQGDRVDLGNGDVFTIKEVKSLVEPKYEHLAVLSNSLRERYMIKELIL